MLEIRDLHVAYGHVRALSGVSLTVPAGSVFAVLGANGAGKTTLLRSILGLVSASGTIRFAESDLATVPTFERIRRGIALVPEGRRLFPDFTVEENLRIGAFNRTDRAEVERDIDDLCDMFPVLRSRYRQSARTLSGGEGQMLAIGRALLSRPRLLLLDEPSVGLMPIAVAEIFRMIGEVPRQRGITVLLVEQNARKALAIADRAAVLELGQLVFQGDAAGVAADPRIQEAYLGAA
ncbi:MAG TPA: ABC transporter ATP-binding protein [Alphaproteobacteria bacterium]